MIAWLKHLFHHHVWVAHSSYDIERTWPSRATIGHKFVRCCSVCGKLKIFEVRV